MSDERRPLSDERRATSGLDIQPSAASSAARRAAIMAPRGITFSDTVEVVRDGGAVWHLDFGEEAERLREVLWWQAEDQDNFPMDRRWDRIKEGAAEMREWRLMLWKVTEPSWEDARFEVKKAVIKAWLEEDPEYAAFMNRPYGEFWVTWERLLPADDVWRRRDPIGTRVRHHQFQYVFHRSCNNL